MVLDIDDFNPQLEKLLRFAVVVIGSEVFAQLLNQNTNYLEAAQQISHFDPRTVVFTLGSRGCFVGKKINILSNRLFLYQ